MFTIFIQSEISNVIPNALLRTIQSQSGFNNANILQIMFANVTPIGPHEKMQSRNTCNTNSFCRSHIYWQYSWVTSAPFVPSKDRKQKASKNGSLLAVSLFVYDDFEKHRSPVYFEVC